MRLERIKKLTPHILDRCLDLSYKYFKVSKDELSDIINNAIKEDKLYLLLDKDIEGFAIAYRYTDGKYNFLMIDYVAINRDLKVRNYLWSFIILFGMLDFVFYKKIKSNKYRLLGVDYESNMLSYINIKRGGNKDGCNYTDNRSCE